VGVGDVKQITLRIEKAHISYPKTAKLVFHEDVEW